MNLPSGIDRYGVMTIVPPRVMAVVSLWVVIADGIFWGMSVNALRLAPWVCVVQGLLLCASLLVLSIWPVLRVATALLSTALFGAIIFSFCGLLGFTLLVAAQIGLMHYCALAVLAPWINRAMAASSNF